MNQTEIEKLLLDPESFAKLSQQAKTTYPDIQSGTTSSPSSSIESVAPPQRSPLSLDAKQTARPLARVVQSSLLFKIDQYYPTLKGKSPEKALQWLINRYEKEPSAQNQFLVQDAINRVATQATPTPNNTKFLRSAINDFVQIFGSDPDVTGAVFALLYQHADFNGRSTFAFLGRNAIYHGVRKRYLSNVRLHDAISSFSLNTTTSDGRGDLILLQHDQYHGRFIQYRTDASGSSQEVRENYVGDYINDRTSSLLLVRRFEGEKIAALGTDSAKDVIKSVFDAMDGVKVDGDPIFTWDMFPTGGDNHPDASDRYFAQVKIPVIVDPPNWPWDYAAELRLWFYFYIDNGNLKGHLAYYGAYVSGGLITQRVLRGVMDALADKVGEINSLLDLVIAPINNGGPFRHVYLLPGNQMLFTGSKYQGYTTDDVSVVLVPESVPFDFTQVATELIR